jgi:hypothetical protein
MNETHGEVHWILLKKVSIFFLIKRKGEAGLFFSCLECGSLLTIIYMEMKSLHSKYSREETNELVIQ